MKMVLNPDPELYLHSHKIPIVNQVKFLGIIFDKEVNLFTTHKTSKRPMPRSTQPAKSCFRD